MNTWGQRGSKVPSAKLNEDQVREIKRLIQTGIRYQDIAEQYGVGKTTTANIATGLRWSHVKLEKGYE
jgi:DNA invertase Pin-like site-specific DNA recombinase